MSIRDVEDPADLQRDQMIRRALKNPNHVPLKEATWEHIVVVGGHAVVVRGCSDMAREDLVGMGKLIGNIDFGRWVMRHYDGDFLVDGRPMTMFMMSCRLQAGTDDFLEQVARGECCGEVVRDDGRCPHHPADMCPLVSVAGRIIRQETGE